MQARKYKTFDPCLVLEPAQLQQLLKALELADEDVTYTVECSDGTTLNPVSLDQLLALPNPANRAIKSIDVSTRYSSKKPVQITLAFGREAGLGAASYRISGDDADISAVATTVEDHMRPMIRRFWLHPDSRVSIEAALLLVGAVIGCAATFVLISLAVAGHRIFQHRTMPSVWISAAAVASMLFVVIGFGLLSIVRRLWPTASFLIGAGRNRYATIVDLRRNLFWCVIVAFVIGAVVAVVF